MVSQSTPNAKPIHLIDSSFGTGKGAIQFNNGASGQYLVASNININSLLGDDLGDKTDTTIFLVQKVDTVINSSSFMWENRSNQQRFQSSAYWENNLYFDFGFCCTDNNNRSRKIINIDNSNALKPNIISYVKNSGGTTIQQSSVLFNDNYNTRSFTNPTHTQAITQNTSDNFHVGSFSTHYFFKGQIAELLIYSSALTTAQINSVQNYLATKWGIAKVCNTISSPTGYTPSTPPPANLFTHGQTLTCNTGYNGAISVDCQNYGGTASVNGGCNINTCTAQSSPIGYTLPAGFIYNYNGTASTKIAESSCASGYIGTANVTYTCNNTTGGSVPASISASGCTINSCGTLTNSNYSSKSGVFGNTATCNGDSGYGSSTPGTAPTCQANGTWSATCRWNSCNVKQIAGYNPLPPTVSNTNSTTTDLNYFNPTVSCATGYYSMYGEAKYRCWNTNANGTNIDIYPQTCFLSCGTLANSNHDAIRGYPGNIATCNGSAGYGSSTPGTAPTCKADGAWSATCVTNLCNVNRGVIGYNYITTDNPPTVLYGANRAGDPNAGSGTYLFSSDYIKCADGYSSGQGSDGKSAVFQCDNKNSDGKRINIDPIWCAPN